MVDLDNSQAFKTLKFVLWLESYSVKFTESWFGMSINKVKAIGYPLAAVFDANGKPIIF